MMFLAAASVLAATAIAQNPFGLLAMECAIAFPQCMKKAGYETIDALNNALVEDADYLVVFPPILKCLQKEKFGKMADEVDVFTGYACESLVNMLVGLLPSEKAPVNDDPKCARTCENTFESCVNELDLNLLFMSTDDIIAYEQCQVEKSVNEAGCCECLDICPDLSEDNARRICNGASSSEDACSKALMPHYGLCSYHKNGKMKNQARMCKLHSFWKGNCAGLNRRTCKIAVEAKACDPVQKEGKKKYKKCVERETSR